jgi:23S rRNA (guanosine2251-2'-O)-methyltransferase
VGRAGLAASNTLLYGIHAVSAALANARRKVRHAYFTENVAAKLKPLAEARGIAFSLYRPSDLDELLGAGAVHQGAVLDVEPLSKPSLDEFLATLGNEPAKLCMLDQVTDPHNVGAILRSACAFSVAALIMQDRHSPPLSGTLAKAASGALEYVSIIFVVNLSRALERLKEHDFRCIGFDSEADSSFDAAAAAHPRTAFVFGAEDRGLRRLIREGCDLVCALDTPGPIKSLNVSNAAAIAFHTAVRGTQAP